MINVAVVGLGFMGYTHIKAYRQLSQARLATICDAVKLPEDGVLIAPGSTATAPDAIRLDLTQVKATKSLEEVLADPTIDLVDLCVPTLAHPKLAIQALAAGKHVVCEKPLARSSAAAREIAAAAAQAKGFFLTAHCIRFWPEYAWLRQVIAAGTYGRCLGARFRRVSEAPLWGKEHFFNGAKSGGALLDLHIHDADFVQYCFGRPQAVYAQGLSLYSGEIDHVTVQYRVAGGATVSAEGSWAMAEGHGFEMSYQAVFERATVDYNCTRGADALKLYENGQKPRTVALDAKGDGYYGELGYMLDCIAAGRAPTNSTAADGVSAVEICEAEDRSAKTGQVVTL